MIKSGVVLFLVCFVLGAVVAHPTMYKFNENKKLEADLVAVSSTVIPLPVYQVGVGLNASSKSKAARKRPDGPATLVTVHNQKQFYYEEEKPKKSGTSSIKEVSKSDFKN